MRSVAPILQRRIPIAGNYWLGRDKGGGEGASLFCNKGLPVLKIKLSVGLSGHMTPKDNEQNNCATVYVAPIRHRCNAPMRYVAPIKKPGAVTLPSDLT